MRKALKKVSRRKILIFVALAFAAGFLVYGNSLNNPFHFDDNYLIAKNTKIYELGRTTEFFKSVLLSDTGGYTGYRPLIMASFSLNYYFSKLDPYAFRITNLVFHILNAILVFFLLVKVLRRLFPHQSEDVYFLVCALSSLLFLVHPVNTIAINFIWKRSTVLYSFFVLLGLIWFETVHSRFYLGDKKRKLARLGSLTVLCLFFVFALLSKETAIVFPLVVSLLFVTGERERWKQFLLDMIPLALILAIFLWFRMYFFKDFLESINFVGYQIGSVPGRFDYLVSQFDVVTRYVGLLLFPQGLSIYHEAEIPGTFFDLKTLLEAGFLLSLIVLACFSFKRFKWFFFGVSWFFLFLVPSSTIHPLSIPMDEVRLYMPSVGFCLIFSFCVLLIYRIFEPKRGRRAVVYAATFACLTVVLSAHNAFMRNSFYASELLVWSDAVLKYPNSLMPRLYLGNLYKNLGKLKEAKKHIEKAIEINPESSIAHVYLGIIYQKLGQYDEAIDVYEALLNKDVMNYYANLNLGMIYRNRGDNEKAIAYLKKACDLDANGFEAFRELGSLYMKLGDGGGALKYLNKSYLINRYDPVTSRELGYLYLGLFGNPDRGIEYFKESLALEPNPALKRMVRSLEEKP